MQANPPRRAAATGAAARPLTRRRRQRASSLLAASWAAVLAPGLVLSLARPAAATRPVLNDGSQDVLDPEQPQTSETLARHQFDSSDEQKAAVEECHTAEEGDFCYGVVTNAMSDVKVHPELYAPLTKDSSFYDFQLSLYHDGRYDCDAPCEEHLAEDEEETGSGDAKEEKTADVAEEQAVERDTGRTFDVKTTDDTMAVVTHGHEAGSDGQKAGSGGAEHKEVQEQKVQEHGSSSDASSKGHVVVRASGGFHRAGGETGTTAGRHEGDGEKEESGGAGPPAENHHVVHKFEDEASVGHGGHEVEKAKEGGAQSGNPTAEQGGDKMEAAEGHEDAGNTTAEQGSAKAEAAGGHAATPASNAGKEGDSSVRRRTFVVIGNEGSSSAHRHSVTAGAGNHAGPQQHVASQRVVSHQHVVSSAPHPGHEGPTSGSPSEDNHTVVSSAHDMGSELSHKEHGHGGTGEVAAHGEAGPHGDGGHGGGHEHAGPHPHVVLCFLIGGVSLGCIIQVIQDRLLPFIPYTCLLFVVGLGAALLHELRPKTNITTWPTWYQSVSMWERVDPHLVFYIFLPLLVFAEAMKININLGRRLIFQVLLLAGPGVVIGAGLTATFCKFCLPYGWSWATSLVFGSILAATDPVAVVALFNTLGVSPRLTLLVSGESLLNDGTAIVLFSIVFKLMLGEEVSAWQMCEIMLRMTTLSVLLGIGLAVVALVLIKQCAETQFHTDAMIQVAVTISLSMLCFFLAEQEVHTSGVLTVVTAGCVISYSAWPSFCSRETMHTVWEAIEFVGNTTVFLLAGLLFGHRCITRTGHLNWTDFGLLFALYFAATAIRAVMMVCFWPVMNLVGPRVSWQEVVVMIWSGLRGAVGLVLAIIVDEEPSITKRIGSKFMFHIGGIAMLTLVVNATLSPLLLKKLGLTTPPHIEHKVHHHFEKVTRDDARAKFEQIIREQKDKNSRWKDADMEQVQSMVPSLRPAGAEEGHDDHHHSEHAEDEEEMQDQNRVYREAFIRFLQAHYWEDIEAGLVPRTSAAAQTLLFVASDALQQPGEPLHDWELAEGLSASYQWRWLKCLSCFSSCWPLSRVALLQGMFPSDQTVQLWKAYLVLSFLSAHHAAREEVAKYFEGCDTPPKEVQELICQESTAQTDLAAAFVETLTKETVVRGSSRMLAGKLLKQMLEKVESLSNAGVLDSSGAAHISHVVQDEYRKVAGSTMLAHLAAGKHF